MQNRHVLVVLIVMVLVALIAWWQWPRTAPAGPSTPAGAAQVSGQGRPSPPEPTPDRGDDRNATGRLRRLEPADRLQLGGRIAAAIARARVGGQQAGGSAAAAEDLTISLEQVSAPVQDMLREAIPLLAECYPQATGKTAAALMTMTSDPDLGTVIDTREMTDADGKPLDAKVDECLRDTIDSLALPGLGPRGTLELQYTFRFD